MEKLTELRMGPNEMKFAKIIWKNEPLTSMKLADLAKEQLSWAKTTSYTVLRRLCAKGIFQNDRSLITSILNESEYHALRGEQFVESDFGGSLPAFVASFAARKELSPKDVEELRRIVDEYRQK